MKKYLFLLICNCLIHTACNKQNWSSRTVDCQPDANINMSHHKSQKLQKLMDQYIAKGLPGIAIAIYDKDGMWTGASGYAQIESKVQMKSCHLQYSQSVAKTYMSVAILKMAEEGKIELDESISNYLPDEIQKMINQQSKITVRMLMNHTSGIPEYNSNPYYVSYLLQHPLEEFKPIDYIRLIKGKPLKFEPGTKMQYTNTNYVLLAMIADYITGDHRLYMKEKIFDVAGLKNTYYHDTENYLEDNRLVNSYWDRYSQGGVENCSEMQKTNVKTLVGDDGIVATPVDYVLFMKALFEEKIINKSSLAQMLTFYRNNPEKPYGYGLGMGTNTFMENMFYRHSGGGIGSGCQLVYFPKQEVYLFVGINLGTIIDSPILEQVKEMEKDLFEVLIE
jgi:D-alanyl-D-alanine carboxypeptidase